MRFAVVWDGGTLEQYQATAIDALLAVPDMTLALIIQSESGGAPVPSSSSYFHTLIDSGRASGWREPIAPQNLFAGAEARIVWHSGSSSPDGPRRQIAAAQLDFILNMSRDDARSLSAAAAHGVWEFRFGDGHAASGEHALFWELLADSTTAFSWLVQLGASASADRALRYACIRASNHPYRQLADELRRRARQWPAHVCRDIAAQGAIVASAEALPATSPARGAPGFAACFHYLGRYAARRLRSLYQDLFRHEQWNVGVIAAPIATVLGRQHPERVDWLPQQGKSEFLADCFGVVRDGKLVMLCEYLHRHDGRGRIVAVRPGTPANERVDIGPEPPVHLSYPYLLEAHGQLFCVPETHEAKEVGLYEPEEFPTRWRKRATLLEGFALVDATLFEYAQAWWLAGSEVAHKGSNCELNLWHAPRLEGPWRPHAQNPVKVDVRSARPGGTPFLHEGALYRPAQDCSRTYGGQISINRVHTLTPECFREDAAGTFAPDPHSPYPAGLHTLSAAGDYTLIDAKRVVFVWRELVRVLRWMSGHV